MSDLVHNEISKDIIGAAMAVLNELKPGLDEKIYERALVIELNERKHTTNQQKQFPVHFKDQRIGILIPDLIVDDQVIVEAKVATMINDSHVAQLIGYLSHTGLRLGLILNFKHAKLQWKRIVL
jgi:GxxExxY protein